MSAIIKCKFCDPDSENFGILRPYLPLDYEYIVCNLHTNNNNFKTRIRTNGKNQDYAQKWLEEFQMLSKCTMRVERTYPHSGTKNVFKIDLRCQHNTRPRSEKVREKESCKNTDCPAKMGITIKRVVTERKSRSKDPHLPEYPTVIQMDFCHNHAILTPEILKHRSVLPEVRDKILTLYKWGHNPSTALDMHKYDLLLEYGENFEEICHDRALLPDFQFCYRLYYKIVRKNLFNTNDENVDREITENTICHKKSPLPLSNCENSSAVSLPSQDTFHEDILSVNSTITPNGKKTKKKRKLDTPAVDKDALASQLEKVLCKFCENGGLAGMQIVEGDSVMALCTPLMLRVHSLIKQSGELVFVDTYGELDEPNSCRVFLFVTYSSIGAIPLGCLIATSDSASCIQAALDLWKQILPAGSFYNKSEGPEVLFTGDNEAQIQSLKIAFPKSHVLICLSHILQSTWTFLLDRKNTIKKEHKWLFFSKVKMLLYSQTAEELDMNYAYAVGDSLVKSNTAFHDYLKHLYDQRQDWSLVYRRHLLPRASDMSLFWESAMIILKDPILSRSRTFNQLQVIDFLTRLDTYYERKLIDVANNRLDSFVLSRFIFIELPREAYTITQFSEIEYEIHNDTKDTAYQIDISLGVCECRTGKCGAPCKHQLLVYRNFPIPVYDCVPPSTAAEKNWLLQLATGQKIESESSISKTVQSAMQVSCTATEITINELQVCNENDFFLDENGTCESLSQNSAIGNSILSQQSSINLPTNTLIQTSPVLEQTGSSSQVLLNNLLPQLDQDTSPIALNPQINPPLNFSFSSIDQPPSFSQSSLQSNAPNASVNDVPQQTAEDIINQICTKLKERTSGSPHIFKPALGTFLKSLDRLTSTSSLEYALYSFGKYSKLSTPLFKRKIVDNKLIGIQSAGELKKRRQPPLKYAKILKKT